MMAAEQLPLGRRQKTERTTLGDQLRTFAAAYAATEPPQKERAEGLLQAADTVDAAFAGTTTGIVDHPIVRVLLELVRSLTLQARELAEAAAAFTAATGGAERPKPAARRETKLPTIVGPELGSAFVGAGDVVARAHRAGAPFGVALGAGERRILAAVVAERDGLTPAGITTIVGLKKSTRDRYLGVLVSYGFVLRQSGRVHATDDGRAELGPFKKLPTGAALLAMLLGKLPQGEADILRAVADGAGAEVDSETISERVGLKKSTRDRYLLNLRARELVVGSGRGFVLAPKLRGRGGK